MVIQLSYDDFIMNDLLTICPGAGHYSRLMYLAILNATQKSFYALKKRLSSKSMTVLSRHLMHCGYKTPGNSSDGRFQGHQTVMCTGSCLDGLLS